MTKFIVIEIQSFESGKPGTIIYTYDNENEAVSAYYSILAAAAISTVKTHSAVLMNDTGFVIKNDSFTH